MRPVKCWILGNSIVGTCCHINLTNGGFYWPYLVVEWFIVVYNRLVRRLTCIYPPPNSDHVNLSHTTDCTQVYANRTIVTSQMNHHMIWIGYNNNLYLCPEIMQYRLKYKKEKLQRKKAQPLRNSWANRTKWLGQAERNGWQQGY